MRPDRAAAVLLAAVAAGLAAWPASAASPAPSAAPAATFAPVQLPLAPPGWMFATREVVVDDPDGEGPTRLEVLAASPTGEVRTLATIPDLFAGLRGSVDIRDYEGQGPLLGPDGRLAIPYAQDLEDGSDGSEGVRVLDLTVPDPTASAVDVDLGAHAGGTSWTGFAADGTLAVYTPDESYRAGMVMVLPPHSATVGRVGVGAPGMAAWLADFSGWGAWQGPWTTDLAGTVTQPEPPVPLLDLAYGAEQRSIDGLVFQTYDIGAGPTRFAAGPHALAMQGMAPYEECIYDFWVAGERDAHEGRITVWDDCVLGRLLDIRWDVDGRDLLELYRRGRAVNLVRRDLDGHTAQLARFPVADLEPEPGPVAYLRVYVDALMAGPRPDELLLVMRATQSGGGDPGHVLTFRSTTDGVPVHLDGARFAGFSVAPVPAATAAP
ncbi:MAG: hypothetical protein U0869_01635 [Chloroflexota bacterium]